MPRYRVGPPLTRDHLSPPGTAPTPGRVPARRWHTRSQITDRDIRLAHDPRRAPTTGRTIAIFALTFAIIAMTATLTVTVTLKGGWYLHPHIIAGAGILLIPVSVLAARVHHGRHKISVFVLTLGITAALAYTIAALTAYLAGGTV